MFKRISAVVMVAVMSAMLSLTAFAEVDREAVEKKLIEYFYEDDWASITRNADGDHIPIEDNPNASLYYNGLSQFMVGKPLGGILKIAPKSGIMNYSNPIN